MTGPERILVTGASGFVGRNLVPHLEQHGMAVTQALRTGVPARQSTSVSVGDIGPETNWAQALRDIDAVVHLAAHVHVIRPRAQDDAQFERVNVQGTLELAQQALQAGVRRFVFLSSVKVNGERTDEVPFRSTDVPAPADAYARSKLRAEQQLSQLAGAQGLQVAMIRCPLVYGPGVGANFRRLMSLVERGVPLPLASVNNRRSLINVWNLSDMIVAALRTPLSQPLLLMASDGEDVSTPALLRKLGAALRRPARLLPCSPAVLRMLGAVVGRKEVVRRLTDSLHVDIAESRRLLSWQPAVSIDEALRRTLQAQSTQQSGQREH